MDDVLGLAAAVRRHDITATETVVDCLARIDASPLNAFTLVDHEGALARAALIDEMIQSGEDPGPLAGVPIAVKDLIDQAGLLTTAGSSFYRSVPEHTAPAVGRLEAAGAIAVGRTGLHEFAFGFSSENHWFGPVRNPWDPNTSPGGSSGGSGAAVAAGLAAAALGTDTGGSIRVPAALCGLVGLKVTHGRIPISGVFPLAPSLDTVGPITRSVGDAGLIYSLMAGGDPGDPWSSFSPAPAVRPQSGPDGLRIGVPTAWIDDAPLTNEVTAGFDGLVRSLDGIGVSIEAIELPDIVAPDLLLASVYGEVAAVHRSFRASGKHYGPEVEQRMQRADEVTLDEYVNGLAWRARLRQSFERAFAGVDLIVTPATCTTTKTIGSDTVDSSSGSVHYRSALSWFSAPINHAAVPALVVPLAIEGSPPPALQIIGPWWHEQRLLDFGAYLEAAGLSKVTVPPV
ncbi:MAG: amidase [Acidimicrobiia bacterium]|nr:amidase [Acidimicrobiia bacterium]